MKVKTIILFLLCYNLMSFGQQAPHYTQYMYNMSVVNPAYVINEPGLVEIGSLYRTQWVGIKGAPVTTNVFAHIPLNNDIELSVNYINDKIGSNVSIATHVLNIDTSYKINITEYTKLSFGLKTGVDLMDFNFKDSNVASDPLFDDSRKTIFNIGAGVFMFQDHFYVGLSSPNLIPQQLNVENMGSVYSNKPHLFLIAGYVFEIGDYLKLKPSAVAKEVFGAPLSYDASLNILYNDRFELGVSYRNEDAYAGLVGINITPSLRLGYSFDYNTSDLNVYNDGTHEFVLLYKFDVLGLRKKYSSPRFY